MNKTATIIKGVGLELVAITTPYKTTLAYTKEFF